MTHWKAILCAVSILWSGACSMNGHDKHGDYLTFSICPSDAVNEALITLGLGGEESVRLAELLTVARSRGFTVEETTLRLRSTQCVERPADSSMTIHVIHAGFDPSNAYTRHFVVLSDETGNVTDIEVQRAYPAR